jgi:hypothetical protein
MGSSELAVPKCSLLEHSYKPKQLSLCSIRRNHIMKVATNGRLLGLLNRGVDPNKRRRQGFIYVITSPTYLLPESPFKALTKETLRSRMSTIYNSPSIAMTLALRVPTFHAMEKSC